MDQFIIEGGVPLKGTVHLGGAKNAGFKMMIASLLMSGKTELKNITPIGDVQIVKDIITSLGGTITEEGTHHYFLEAENINSFTIAPEFGEKSRASLFFAGPLLHKFGKAVIPYPGGDKIGTTRDLDRHFDGLKALGVTFTEKDNLLYVETQGLKGAHFTFNKPSHTATETILLAAVVAKGKTILENCALEPEVDDLISFLNDAGAHISRKENRTLEIEGVETLQGVSHTVIADRNQAVTYALAAILTEGDVTIEDANAEHLQTFLQKLDEANGGYEITEKGMRFFYKGTIKPTSIATGPQPEFMTDWMPLWTVFMTQAEGESKIVERIYDNRFQFVDILNKAGAHIEYFDPKPENPQTYYYFNMKPEKVYDKQGIVIQGKTVLNPISAAVWDVRFGATLLLTALIAPGKSHLTNIHHIDRGYDKIDEKLQQLGAKVQRIKVE